MKFDYIRALGVPANRGRYVEVFYDNGSLIFGGKICSVTGHYLKLRSGRDTAIIHPTWNAVYYSDDLLDIIKDTRAEPVSGAITKNLVIRSKKSKWVLKADVNSLSSTSKSSVKLALETGALKEVAVHFADEVILPFDSVKTCSWRLPIPEKKLLRSEFIDRIDLLNRLNMYHDVNLFPCLGRITNEELDFLASDILNRLS